MFFYIDGIQQRTNDKNQAAAQLHPDHVTRVSRQDDDCQRIDKRDADRDHVVDILLLVGGEQCQIRQTTHIFGQRRQSDGQNEAENIESGENRDPGNVIVERAQHQAVYEEERGDIVEKTPHRVVNRADPFLILAGQRAV